jgi:hypothetical protein
METDGTKQDLENATPPWERRAAWAKSVIANMPRRREIDRTVAASYQAHVYFAYSAGRIKIGTSTNVAARTRNLNGNSAHPVTIILTGLGGAADEAKFHAVYADERLHNEWFTFSPRIREFLNRIMCRKGRRKLKLAEAEFRKWVREQLAP